MKGISAISSTTESTVLPFMPDTWENNYGLEPLADDANEDPDKDKLTNYEEFLKGSDPGNRNDPEPTALPWLPMLLE
jgi:hypothetical protein